MSSELQEIKDLVTEFEDKLQTIKEKYSEPEPEFEEGDPYWSLDDTGCLRSYEWFGDPYDETLLQIGNAFKSADEAEFMVEKLKVIQELKQMGRPFKVGDQNWMIQYDIELRIFVTQSYEQKVVAYGDFYFDTKDELRKAVEKIGEDRVKKYLFNVED